MNENHLMTETVEISPRFRKTIEERIVRLEEGAARDEAQLAFLENADHVRRQRLLIAMQRSEALRMRIFLDHSRIRIPRPFIAL